MRVFIGIKASDNVKEQIRKWQEKHKDLSVRFIKPSNLHITLIPPWHTQKIDKTIKQFKKFGWSSQINLQFREVIFAPKYFPRLIWAQGGTPKDLIYLRKSLHEYFEFKIEKRPYLSHLTLARLRPFEFQSFKNTTIEGKIDWQMDVREITLFESKLSPLGAEYKVIETRSIFCT